MTKKDRRTLLRSTVPAVPEAPRCACDMLSASIDDGVIQRADFERVRKGFRTERMRMFSVNKLSETDPEEAFQDGLVILFCPFCGGTLGDHKHIRKYLAETMPTN